MPLPAIGAMVASEVVAGGEDPCGDALNELVRKGPDGTEPAAPRSAPAPEPGPQP